MILFSTLAWSRRADTSPPNQNPELSYVYLRAAYLQLGATLFQDAFTLFLRSQCDPRLVVRMFPDLREPLIGEGDEVEVCEGVRGEVEEGKTFDDYSAFSLSLPLARRVRD